MNSDLQPLEVIIKQFGLSAKKNLGQHFLLDAYVTDQVVATAGDLSSMHVIEIGPGPGGLTRSLLASNAASVTVIEKDERCLPIMEMLKQAQPERFSYHQGDATQMCLEDIADAPRCIIANLPYNVGTDLVIGWLKTLYEHGPDHVSHITVMLQKEVVDRIIAQPSTKSYGRLSVLSQYMCDVHCVMEVPPECFTPPPKVDSAVVQLVPKQQRLDINIKLLEKVVRAAFQFRRKKITAALKRLTSDVGVLLDDVGLDENIRPDQISVEDYIKIVQSLSN